MSTQYVPTAFDNSPADYGNFIKLGKYLGIREDLVQAGGGNISYKTKEELIIKASGKSLFDVDSPDGVSRVLFSKANGLMEKINRSDFDEAELLYDAAERKSHPSIETFIHFLTKKWTMHIHPLIVIKLLETKKDEILEAVPGSIFIDYVKPGIDIVRAVVKEVEKTAKVTRETIPSVIFMKNHGVIFSAETYETLMELFMVTMSKLYLMDKNYPDFSDISTVQTILKLNYGKNFYIKKFDFIPSIQAATPDCVVYTGKEIVDVEDKEVLPLNVPKIVKFKDNYYAVGSNYTQCCWTIDIAKIFGIDYFEGILLNENQVNILLDWKSEKIRSEV